MANTSKFCSEDEVYWIVLDENARYAGVEYGVVDEVLDDDTLSVRPHGSDVAHVRGARVTFRSADYPDYGG